MIDSNPVAQLCRAGAGTELWWDSSPLVYQRWLGGPGAPYRNAGLFDLQDTANGPRLGIASHLSGATTNQPLTQQVMELWPDQWAAWLANQKPSDDPRAGLWSLFIEVAARGADMLAPIFEASDRRRGQICCQVDPRDLTDLTAMLAQARRIHAARPNIMVKMPGTAEGIEGVRILTAEGMPTNVTLGFTVAQLVAVGEAAAGRAGGGAAARDRPAQLAVVRGDDAGALRRCARVPGAGRRTGHRADRRRPALGGHRHLPQGAPALPGARLSQQADGGLNAPGPHDRRETARLAPGKAGRRECGADRLPQHLRSLPGELRRPAPGAADRRAGAG